MKLAPTILSAAMALTMAIGSALPTSAAPIFVPKATSPTASSSVEQVQYRSDRRGRFERRGDGAYFNGKRGYRTYRRGYRQYNGFWFPTTAFIAGAIIGGALNQPAVRPSGNAHVRWCTDRWRSYRAYDNTYQPSSGPRRACVSPYG